MEDTWDVLRKDCWLCCFVFWPGPPPPLHTLCCQRSFKNGKELPKVWKWSEKKKLIHSRLIFWFSFEILKRFQIMVKFFTGFSEKVLKRLFVKMWYLIFCWGANRGCGGSRCNKILGIHNNTTKLPTKSQRKPKRWKINWSICASLHKLLCSNYA